MNTNAQMNQRELTKEEANVFLMLQTCKDDNLVDKLYNELAEEDGGWVLKAIKKRFEVHEQKVDKKVMIMILIIGDGIVGKCAQHVDYTVSKAKSLRIDEITWHNFINKISPGGIPEL